MIPTGMSRNNGTGQLLEFLCMMMLVGFIIFITGFSCLHDTRWVCRQAAVEGYHMSYPLLDSPDPSKAQSTVGTVLSISTAPRPSGPCGFAHRYIL